MLLANKRQRKAIYLRLAKIFDKATDLTHYSQKDFVYSQMDSLFVCSCLRHTLFDKHPDKREDIFVNDILLQFPEFALFEPTYEEKIELEGEDIGGSCSAWWDINAKDCFAKKATALYLCAEMCD